MPRKSKPARLWLREVRGTKFWIILDGGKQISTGCREEDVTSAKAKFSEYLAAGHDPKRDGPRAPDQVPVADVLNMYVADRGKTVARPDELAGRVVKLLDFLGVKPVSAINRGLCKDYVRWRETEQGARRELEDLRAALKFAFKNGQIQVDFGGRIELPPKAQPRERWLTRKEAADLIRAAWRFQRHDHNGAPGLLPRRHVARFILVALYTGTRSSAVCEAAMGPAIGRGYVDLEQGVFYRRAPGTAETNKRRPPLRLPDRLLAHIRRWHRLGISIRSVIEYNGEPVDSVWRTFKRCVADAKLTGDVSPHTLRHTAITWAMQSGKVSPWDVGEFFGVSRDVIEKTYAHHHPDHQKAVGEAITRRGHR